MGPRLEKPIEPERQVEAMLALGTEILRGAVETYRPAAIVAAFSGGDDSVVSTHFACGHFGAAAVHCDTGTGLRLTGAHARRTAERFGWALDVRPAPPEGPGGTPPEVLPFGRWVEGGSAYEEFVLNHGFPGPAQHGRIYQRIKERQLRKIARETAPRGRKVLVVSGIRHDESAVRAGYRRAVQEQTKTKLIWVNPFYWQTTADFEAYRQEYGLPRNPVKARLGISGECLCGAFASPGERARVRAVEPEAADYLDRLEGRVRRVGFPWGWGERPPQWWYDRRAGQGMLFALDDSPSFQPMCVRCPLRRSSHARA